MAVSREYYIHGIPGNLSVELSSPTDNFSRESEDTFSRKDSTLLQLKSVLSWLTIKMEQWWYFSFDELYGKTNEECALDFESPKGWIHFVGIGGAGL